MTTGVTESISLSDASTRYLMHLNPDARSASQQELNRFVRWLGGARTLDSLTSHEVSSYPERLGNATDLTKRLESIKLFLAFARKEGFTLTNLGVNIRVKKSASASTESSGKDVPVEKAHLTKEGYQALVDELESHKAQRPHIAEALHLAMADKDFRENAPLDAARDQQAHLEARIRELEGILKRVEVMEEGVNGDATRVQLGHIVVVLDIEADEELRFTLVHSHEANLSLGKLSIASPLGKAVIDRSTGEEVEVTAPGGVQKYRIAGVEVSVAN
jgi:transcription elongation factor GreA